MFGEPRVYFGQGAQTIRFIPVDRSGRPRRITSATWRIVDLDEPDNSSTKEIASGNATISAVDTTLTANAGQGTAQARQAQLTSAVGVSVGHHYLLSNAARSSVVEVVGLAGSVVNVQHTISGEYATGDAFQACELEAVFPSAEANDQDAIDEGRRYQIVWSYTIDDEPWLTAQLVWLHRYSGEAWITEADVVRGYPTLADRTRNRVSIADAIVVATQDLITELETAGAVAENYRTSTPGLVAIRYRAIEHALRWCGGDQDLAIADKYEQRYDRIVRTIITANPGKAVKLDPQDDVAVSPRIDGYFNRP